MIRNNPSVKINGIDDNYSPDTFNSFFPCFERSEFSENVLMLREALITQTGVVIHQ